MQEQARNLSTVVSVFKLHDSQTPVMQAPVKHAATPKPASLPKAKAPELAARTSRAKTLPPHTAKAAPDAADWEEF